MKLYLAGPLFTAAEREFNRRLARGLEKLGHEVFLPQEHVDSDQTAKEIYETDIEGIHWAETIVANMDGPDPDSGTAWECGYATALKKKVLTYRTDLRSAADCDNSAFNLMLSQSSTVLLIGADHDNVAEGINKFLP